MVKLPVRPNLAAGVNVTVTEHAAPGASDAPQLLACAKSPVVVMAVIINAIFPELVSVTVCPALAVWTNWLPKARLAGATPAIAAIPVPLRLAEDGGALELTVTVAPRPPMVSGVNVTLTVQPAPGSSATGQLFV